MTVIRPALKIKLYLVWEDDPMYFTSSFDDYIWLMWNIKTKAFVNVWGKLINKMHILKIEADVWADLAKSVNDFIHEQKDSAYQRWMTRTELYDRRDETRHLQYMRNRRFTLNTEE